MPMWGKAMHDHDRHVADHELLLAVDHELPVHRQADVDGHLAQCAACRTRHTQLGRSAAQVAQVYERAFEPHDSASGRSRVRLQAKLLRASDEWERSAASRFLSGFMMAPRWALPVAALTVTALLIRALHPLAMFDPSRSAASLERHALPIASITPGATVALDVDQMCAGGVRSRPARLPIAVRQQVLRDYGMERASSDEYELDYLITPELGGAPDPRNLWPQRYAAGPWNAHVKDQLERVLPQLVCSGRVDLQTAQRDIAVDWIAAYKKYLNTENPLQARAGAPADDDDPEFGELEASARVRPEPSAAPGVLLVSLLTSH
jgi:hypothetical protein